MLAWLLTLGCDPAPDPATPLDTGAAVDPTTPIDTVDPVQWAARASLDLRGVRATPDELARVAQDSDALAELVATWIGAPAFSERMTWRYNDRLHMALGFTGVTVRDVQSLSTAQREALGWEPLELVRATLAADRPFSDVVTASWLPRHADQASVWGWDHSGGSWEPYGAPDSRPMAGILSSSSLWLRYDGDSNNHNRRRANALADLFLCADFLERDGDFEFDLSPEDLQDMENAIRTEPACQSCHAALDPLAAQLGGFAERSVPEPWDQLGVYSTFDEAWYRGWNAPAYFGTPTGDLTDLGAQIAGDRRFATCTAQTFAEGLLGRPLTADDPLDAWTQTLIDADLRVSELALAVVLSDPYGAADERTLAPDQLHAVLVDLGADDAALHELSWDPDLRVLAGGSDDAQVLEPNRSPGLGHHLVLAWAGTELAAQWSDPTTADTRRADVTELHWTLLSRAPSDAEVDALIDLYDAAGWDAVVQGLVRHPEFLIY
jgi:hypothetical protein